MRYYAASMNQPFAHFLMTGEMEAAGKSRGTDYGGPLLLHACQTRQCMAWDAAEFDLAFGLVLPEAKTLAFGAIIGMVDLIDVRDASTMPGHRFAHGSHIWFFANPRRIEPIRWPGKPGLWTADLDPDAIKFV